MNKITTVILLLIALQGIAMTRHLERLSIPSGKYSIDALAVSQANTVVRHAIIFIGGSGAWEIVDSYLSNPETSYGNLLRFYVEEDFLSNGGAILYLNKRGLGKSTGDWRKSGFQERADDVVAAIQFAKQKYRLNDNEIGLLGHSQGCWIAQIAANRIPTLAFIINLGGPFTGPYEQTLINDRERLTCEGYSPKKIKRKIFWRKKELGLGKAVGRLLGGEPGHWARIAKYNNETYLRNLITPSLFVFGEFDQLVPPKDNLLYANTFFKGTIPSNIEIINQKGIDHFMHEARSSCDPYPWTLSPVPPHSRELREKLVHYIQNKFNKS